MDRNDWAHFLQVRLDIPENLHYRNAKVLVAQMQAEGGEAAFNPLNCVMDMHVPGQTNYNTIGVKNYPSLDVGFDATVKTLKQTNPDLGFDVILARLHKSKTELSHGGITIVNAICKSQWGTDCTLLKAVYHDITELGLYNQYASKKIAGT